MLICLWLSDSGVSTVYVSGVAPYPYQAAWWPRRTVHEAIRLGAIIKWPSLILLRIYLYLACSLFYRFALHILCTMSSSDVEFEKSKADNMAKIGTELRPQESVAQGVNIECDHLLRRLNNRQIQLIAIGKYLSTSVPSSGPY